MHQLQVFRAARIETLADRLASYLRSPVSDPLQALRPVSIAVGNKGMERWLRTALADRLQIASNLVFPFPRQAIVQLLQLPEADDARWSREALVWTVLQVLPSLRAHPAVAPVVTWLRQQSQRQLPDGSAPDFAWPPAVDAQEWALATEIASVLDKVAVYRPALLQQWSTQVASDQASAPWQHVVWSAVQAHLSGRLDLGEGEQVSRHPTLRLLEENVSNATGTLHIFAVSNLPAVWLNALQRAAQTAQVVLYVLTPADGYWGDYQLRRRRSAGAAAHQADEQTAQQQHPLLTSLGKIARDHVQLLAEVADDSEPASSDAFAFHSPHALGQIQRDLAALVPLDALHARRGEVVLQRGDASLQFHACHGPARQVEALREALFALLAANNDLQFRDIVVMTPDVATYAPLVEAIFAEGYSGPHTLPADADATASVWGEFGGPKIRTHIADLGLRQLNPLADALLKMLELAMGRLTAPALADLLALRAVTERFDLDDQSIALVRSWLDEAGARLGADAADRAALGLPEQHQFTLAFALDRLALGVAMADSGDGLFAGAAPYDEMEGDARAVFGAFAEFCAVVTGARHRLQAPRKLSDWIEASVALIDQLTQLPPKASFLRVELLQGLQELQSEGATCDRELTLQAFASTLAARFERPRAGERASGSAVTVCALTPMRSVPFRVVCLLGMDDDAFPRKASVRRFDLVAAQPQPGDPDPREDDRNLFLEALLSARDHLLVFYTGRDPQTDKPLAPAVPVGDLLDVVDATFSVPPEVAQQFAKGRPRELLTWHHCVQPFSPSGFVEPEAPQPGPLPLRFDARMRLAAQALDRPRQHPPGVLLPNQVLADATPSELELDELAAWLVNPMQELLRQRAGVSWRDDDDTLEERESLATEGLAGWKVADRILTALEQQPTHQADVLHHNLAARGLLPPATPGRAVFEDKYQLVEQLRALIPHADRVEIVSLRIEAGGVALRGSVQVADGQPFLVAPSDLSSAKHLLRVWLKVLALAAMQNAEVRANLAGLVRSELKQWTLVSPSQPLALLEDLVAVWREARTRPLPLFEQSSRAWATTYLACKKNQVPGDLAGANRAAHEEWANQSDEGRAQADIQNKAVAAVCGAVSPWTAPERWGDAPAELAKRVWLPVLSNLTEAKSSKGE